MAELVDTVARRGDDEEHDYGGGAATMASAMALESERERRRSEWRVQGSRGRTWSSSRWPGGEGGEAGRQGAARRAPAPASSTCLPGWRGEAARWRGWWAGPARWAAR